MSNLVDSVKSAVERAGEATGLSNLASGGAAAQHGSGDRATTETLREAMEVVHREPPQLDDETTTHPHGEKVKHPSEETGAPAHVSGVRLHPMQVGGH